MGKIRKTINVDEGVWSNIETRMPSVDGKIGSVSAKVELDLVRYQTMIKYGQNVLISKMTVEEAQYMVIRARERDLGTDLALLLSAGLSHIAFDEFSPDGSCRLFGVDGYELRQKIETFSVLEKLALLELIESTCLVLWDDIPSYLRKIFGVHNGDEEGSRTDQGSRRFEE